MKEGDVPPKISWARLLAPKLRLLIQMFISWHSEVLRDMPPTFTGSTGHSFIWWICTDTTHKTDADPAYHEKAFGITFWWKSQNYFWLSFCSWGVFKELTWTDGQGSGLNGRYFSFQGTSICKVVDSVQDMWGTWSWANIHSYCTSIAWSAEC